MPTLAKSEGKGKGKVPLGCLHFLTCPQKIVLVVPKKGGKPHSPRDANTQAKKLSWFYFSAMHFLYTKYLGICTRRIKNQVNDSSFFLC